MNRAVKFSAKTVRNEKCLQHALLGTNTTPVKFIISLSRTNATRQTDGIGKTICLPSLSGRRHYFWNVWNLWPFEANFTNKKSWNSIRAKSGEYAGWLNNSNPISPISVIDYSTLVWHVALSGCDITIKTSLVFCNTRASLCAKDLKSNILCTAV